MEINLRNKVTLITGVKDQLGAEICVKLAEAGSIVLAHQTEKNVIVDQILQQSKEEVVAIVGDLSSPESAKELLGTILNQYNRIDILINYSETVTKHSIHDLLPDEWLRTFEVNLDVPFLCCKEIIPNMIETGEGVILNISSQAAVTGEIGPHYAATKSAIDSMTIGLSKELKDKGIRVNSISPTALIHDPSQMEQTKKAMREAVANMAIFLCSSLAAHITGENITISERGF